MSTPASTVKAPAGKKPDYTPLFFTDGLPSLAHADAQAQRLNEQLLPAKSAPTDLTRELRALAELYDIYLSNREGCAAILDVYNQALGVKTSTDPSSRKHFFSIAFDMARDDDGTPGTIMARFDDMYHRVMTGQILELNERIRNGCINLMRNSFNTLLGNIAEKIGAYTPPGSEEEQKKTEALALIERFMEKAEALAQAMGKNKDLKIKPPTIEIRRPAPTAKRVVVEGVTPQALEALHATGGKLRDYIGVNKHAGVGAELSKILLPAADNTAQETLADKINHIFTDHFIVNGRRQGSAEKPAPFSFANARAALLDPEIGGTKATLTYHLAIKDLARAQREIHEMHSLFESKNRLKTPGGKTIDAWKRNIDQLVTQHQEAAEKHLPKGESAFSGIVRDATTVPFHQQPLPDYMQPPTGGMTEAEYENHWGNTAKAYEEEKSWMERVAAKTGPHTEERPLTYYGTPPLIPLLDFLSAPAANAEGGEAVLPLTNLQRVILQGTTLNATLAKNLKNIVRDVGETTALLRTINPYNPSQLAENKKAIYRLDNAIAAYATILDHMLDPMSAQAARIYEGKGLGRQLDWLFDELQKKPQEIKTPPVDPAALERANKDLDKLQNLLSAARTAAETAERLLPKAPDGPGL